MTRPFEIVCNDITNMQVSVIANTANPRATIDYGLDVRIHKIAGPKLLEARKKIGSFGVSQTAITPAYYMDAKYVVRTVGPIWKCGFHNETALLSQCYKGALELAKEHDGDSIVFSLFSAWNHGFSKSLALQITIREFSSFLMENDMRIYLVVFSQDTFALYEKLFRSMACYIDETYIRYKTLDEYRITSKRNVREAELMQIRRELECQKRICEEIEFLEVKAAYYDSIEADMALPSVTQNGESILEDINAGFSETLLQLIDRTGKKDSDIYKKANIDRKLFSKIRNNMDYKPPKT